MILNSIDSMLYELNEVRNDLAAKIESLRLDLGLVQTSAFLVSLKLIS